MLRLLKWFAAVLPLVVIAGIFLTPPVMEGAMNRTERAGPYTISDESQALHDRLFVADLHADPLLWRRDLLKRNDRGHVDFPRLAQGNVALQVFAAPTKAPPGQNYGENTAEGDMLTLAAVMQRWPTRTWDSLLERALYQLNKLREFSSDSGGQVMLVQNRKDLQQIVSARARGEKTIAAIFAIEGAHALEGDLNNIDRLYDAGMRVLGLSHFFDNEVGGSLHGQSQQGLSEFGRQVVQRAIELEMIIDVAHASPTMVEDVLEMSHRPVILSHGGIKSVCDMNRNLPDELMAAIARRDGILGIGFWDAAVCDPSPEGIVTAIEAAIEIMGVEHVALGSDYDGGVTTHFDSSELAILTQTMLGRGFSEPDIARIMGGNVRDFFLAYLPKK